MQITIIIPTFNRPHYLRRILKYYDLHEEKQFKIIVADSSSDENKQKNKDIVDSVSGLSIQHLNYPETFNPWHKLADSLSYIESEFCLFCADDDFVTPIGIRQCAEFLKHDPEYIAAHGLFINFIYNKDAGNKPRFRWQNLTYTTISIESPLANTRLEYHASIGLTSVFYSVYRTKLLQKVYSEFLQSGLDVGNPIFGEQFITVLTLTYGKLKSLDILYGARDATSGATSVRKSLHVMKNEGKYDEEYARFRDVLARNIREQSLLDLQESEALVDKTMSVYLEKYDPDPALLPKSKKQILLELLHLPLWLSNRISKIYIALYKTWFAPFDNRVSATFTNTSAPEKYKKEIELLHRHILAHEKETYGNRSLLGRLLMVFTSR